jgi:CheY-like chemotaxis protein
MEALVHCAKHQNRIVDDVLQLGKLSMNLISIRKTPFDPLFEIKTCVQRTSANVKISGRSGWVSGDPIRYAQVVLNVLSNAVRFSQNAPIKVVFNTVYPFLTTSVTDSGIGMDTEELSALVHQLDRASPRTYVDYGGSGLGLFISKTLVEAHGGKLSIESEKHKGTKVTFSISVEPSTKPALPSRSPNSKVIHVLIVDDNLINQQVLTRQLQLAGFQTTVANHGAECLEILNNSVDIILMDIEMPVMDGIQAALEIRRREADGPHIPIIAITGNARIEQIERGQSLDCLLTVALSVGMDHVITKPYSKKDLVDRIQAYVG